MPILQWLVTFFAEQDLGDDALACAAALSGIAEATAQPEAIAAAALRLITATTTGSGVVIATYQPDGPVRLGSYALDAA